MSSKKIVLYSINYAPELTGIGKYNAEMAEWLVQNGFDVRVVTAPPYYPEWKLRDGYSKWWYSKENLNGVLVYRCPIWVPRKVTGLKRLLHLATFAASSIPAMLGQALWRPDLIMVIEPPLFVSPFTIVLSKLFRIKSWLHVQDFEVDAAFELGILPRQKKMESFVYGVERWIMKRFHAVSSISTNMINKLYAKGIDRSKVKFFPNWVDISQVYPLPEPVLSIRQELGIQADQFVVLYSGNMGEKQGLEILLDAAERLRAHARIQFIICGNGSAKEKLVAEAHSRGLDNVKFLPLQPIERLNELLNTANLQALIQKISASDLVMPSKLTGMLASGRPILATAMEETAVHSTVTGAEAGVVVPPGDLDALADAVLRLASDPEACRLYGENARRFAVHTLSKESIMTSFANQYAEMMPEIGIKKQGMEISR